MANSADSLPVAAPTHSVSRNRLLNLAFDDDRPTGFHVPNHEEPKSVPADVFKQGVREHARVLGMMLPEDESLLWIAEESLLAPLPEGWVQLKDEESGHPYYLCQASGDSSWEHPRDNFYKDIYKQKKALGGIEYMDMSPMMPPEPPHQGLHANLLRTPFTNTGAFDEETSVRYQRGIEEPPGDGDSACGEGISSDATEKRNAILEEVHRLRRQLQKSKKSRNIIVEQYDEAIAGLEQSKQDLEEKLETVADDLRQEKRRFNSVALERDRVEKMSAKFKDTIRQLEERLETEEHLSGERMDTMDELRMEMKAFKRQMVEANAQKDVELTTQEHNFQQQLTEMKHHADQRIEESKQIVEDARRVRVVETEQMRAKMNFQVNEGVREVLEEQTKREKILIQDIDALRLELGKCKEELAKTRKDASAAAAACSAKLAETSLASRDVEEDFVCRKKLEKEVERLREELAEADIRWNALSADRAHKNELTEKIGELQRTAGEAQEGLHAANERFNQEVIRMNTDVADAEGALERSFKECKRLEAIADEAIADRDKSRNLLTTERAEVKRLSTAGADMEAALSEAKSQVEGLMRQLKETHQRIEVSEGLERDLRRLGLDAEEMQQKSHRIVEDKQREIEAHRHRVEEEEKNSRKLRGDLAEAEGRCIQDKAAAERLMLRVSSLETLVLEGRAALASCEADRSGVLSALAAARESSGREEELRAVVAEGTSREEALRVEVATTKSALEAAEASVKRERHSSSATRADLVKRAEGAESRCDSLQSNAKDMTQKLQDAEWRFQKELVQSKEREAEMWAQLQEVSSNFAKAANTKKEREMAFDAKLGDLEQHIKMVEKQLLESEAECVRVQEAAHREAREREAELEKLRDRLSRKKDKYGAQKGTLEQEIKIMAEKLSAGRVMEEGIRARCKEATDRDEEARRKLARLQDAKIATDQEAAEARAKVAGLQDRLDESRTRLDAEAARLEEEIETAKKRHATASSKARPTYSLDTFIKRKTEARCAILQETADRLEGDLARLTTQVAAGNIDRDDSIEEGSQETAGLKFKVIPELRLQTSQGEIQQLLSRVSTLTTEICGFEEREKEDKARYLRLEAASKQSRQRYEEVKEENEGNKRLVSATQAEAANWKMKFEAERILKRTLSAKILDMQGSIRVLCRLRPLQEAEILAIERDQEYEDPMAKITYPDVDRLSFWGVPYQFDYVFGPGTKQAQARRIWQPSVFDEVQPMIASALEGYRVCVFAYGQTGSGKTYTMEGPKSDRGVNFRALGELFALSAQDEAKDFQFRVSMLEVYNERIKDLLLEPGRPAVAPNKHDIRLDKKGRVYVEGLVECEVEALQEVEELVVLGGRNRTVGNNNVNEHSSRSHLVLQVHITSTDSATGCVQHGKLNLIDLAGSERIKSTAAEGQQLKEAQNINRSLSALGDVINSLGSGSKHVPYRNSKLTFLLQDSLSSNAKVLMFVNINPAPQSQGESSCSLNFAKRCRSVQLGTSRRLGSR
ncbi:unnamed protein product [Scytosiphon promiscuus]